MYQTPVTCPQCRTPFSAKVEQVFDVGRDHAAKQRFLRGRPNAITCPSCKFQSAIASPIVYHDPSKELLLTYVPMELGLSKDDKERMLGSLTRMVINNIPAEQRKGYLLRPIEPLTLQGMVDRVLEADGITKEVMDEQRAKVMLIQQFVTATSEEALTALVKENDAKLDYTFFDLFTALIQASAEQGDRAGAEKMLALRNKIVEMSSLGKQSAEQAKLFEAVAEELTKMGDKLTPDNFFNMVVEAKDDQRLTALVTLARPLVDYNFFMKLTQKANQVDDKERERLQKLREMILETVGQVDQVAQQQGQQAASVLQALVNAPPDKMKQAIMEALPAIDNTFMAILNQNYEAAMKQGKKELAARLKQIGDLIMSTIRDSAPPEIKLINELLSIEDDEERTIAVKRRIAELTPQVIEAMKGLEEELKAGEGRPEVVERLGKIRAIAEKEAMMAKWRV
jgi:hypothetical protein